MAKLTRAMQKVFGSTAGALQIGQFGSLANGLPVYTSNPVTIQALIDFTNGWFDAVLGDGNPAIEDMNALFFLAFYQIAYGFQEGIPEWDTATTYFIGSIVQDGTGGQFVSTLDTNLNNALGGPGWFPIGPIGALNQTVGTQTLMASKRITSSSPLTLAASSTLTVPSTTIAFVPDSVIVPAGSSLIVASGGSVRVI